MIDPDVATFAEIVEAGSLAAAARRLRISAPMISRRLSRLETRLGVTLAHRTTRRFALTPQGERFHADVAVILNALQQAEERVIRSARTASGPLRISAPTSFGRLYVTPALKPFLDQYPDVSITLDLSDGYVDLLRSRFDLAIRITSELPTDLRAERLAGSARVLCAAPAYLAEHGTPQTIAELAEHKLLAAEGQLPWRLTTGANDIVVQGASHVLTNSSEVVRELTLAGMGIALRSLWDVHAELASGRLRRILPDVAGSYDVAIYAISLPAGRTPPAAEAFVAHLQMLFQPEAPWERTPA